LEPISSQPLKRVLWMWWCIQNLSPLPSFSCAISNLICAPASFYRVWGGWISALLLFPPMQQKVLGVAGKVSPPTRLLLVPARRGYRVFVNILFPNMVNKFKICFSSDFRREVDEMCPLQGNYVTYGDNFFTRRFGTTYLIPFLWVKKCRCVG
jgi:hypothetical protein